MSEINLFDTDPYLTELKTSVASSNPDKGGIWYSFRETLFYPQGGGQSSDKGWINSKNVLDVKSDGGDIWHLVNAPLPETVSMKLDWDHRYQNMQQHTGQHILSACFKKYHNLDTLSVHLGHDLTMIELDTPYVEEEVLKETENSANLIIRENLPVESVLIDRRELEAYKLRRKIKTENMEIRLIQIGDIDSVGCGGTHVRQTGEVGLIKIIGSEKIRSHIRIKIKIGQSAYEYYQLLHRALADTSIKLTTSVDELPERIDTLVSEKKELISQKKQITELWLGEYVKALETDDSSGCFALKNFNKEHLKILSDLYLERNQRPCLFIGQESDKIHFYIRLPKKSDLNIQDFIQKNRKQYSLKGGGGPDFAVGQIDTNIQRHFLEEELYRAFKEFINEKDDK